MLVAPFAMLFVFVFGDVTLSRTAISSASSIAFMTTAKSLLVSSPLIGLCFMLLGLSLPVLRLLQSFSFLLLPEMLSSLKDMAVVNDVVIAVESADDVATEAGRSEAYATSIPEYLIPFNSRLTANSCSPLAFVPLRKYENRRKKQKITIFISFLSSQAIKSG